MARATNSRSSGRQPVERSMRGSTPAQRSRYLDEGGKLQAPTIQRYGGPVPMRESLPSYVDLLKLSTEELGIVLDRFGITQPWAQLRAEVVGYVSRMTYYPPGSEQFNAALDAILDRESKSGALGMSRQAYREYEKISVDRAATFVRICEDDENSCDTCSDLGGYEGTYEQQMEVGWPGASSCEGGTKCRCVVVQVD